MLNFFRRLTKSTFGVIIALLFLVAIALGFAMMDVQSLGGLSSLGGNDTVARVGSEKVTATQLADRVDQEWRGLAREQPGLDKAAFVADGGVEQTLERIINGLAMRQFAVRHGMAASERLVEGRIASLPGFRGPLGKFDETVFRRILSENRITEAQLRDDFTRETLASQLIDPVVGASQVSPRLARPYADLLLERRSGVFAVLPITAFPAGAAPTPAEVQAYYARNQARFTVPERRTIRYAVFGAEKVAAAATPTDAEISAEYGRDRANYAARETRDFAQVILADQGAANRMAAAIRGGQSADAAARSAGLRATALNGVEKRQLAEASSAAVADAAFAGAEGSVAGPVRSPLGWHVLRIEAVKAIGARTLAQARAEITARLTVTKREAALANLVADIDAAAAESARLPDLARRFGLSMADTGAVTAAGVNPDRPAAPPAPQLQPVLQAAFQAEQSDDPQVAALPGGTGYIVWDLAAIMPAAARPLAQVRDQVVTGVVQDRQLRAARAAARDVVAAVGRGQPLDAALRATGRTLPPVDRASGTRAEFSGGRGQVPPPVALMFSMAERTAKTLEAPNRQGIVVVYLEDIQPGDASRNAAVIEATRRGLAGAVGREYAAQFIRAIRESVGAEIDQEALAVAKRSIAGGGAAPAQ